MIEDRQSTQMSFQDAIQEHEVLLLFTKQDFVGESLQHLATEKQMASGFVVDGGSV